MSAPPAQPPEQSSAREAGKAADSRLLMDQFLPRYDFAVVHADVLRAPPAQCYEVASELDLFQAPLVRTLLGIRGLPQRVVGTLRGRRKTATLQTSRRTFRFKDMVGLGWILLGETPGVEMVLGQVSRPWKAVAASTDAPATPEQFTSFDEPGFAKIAASLRIDPYGNDASIVTMETRVALTDDKSRRRFRRYWMLIGPFSSLIRRMALRLLATEFRRSAPGRPDDGGTSDLRHERGLVEACLLDDADVLARIGIQGLTVHRCDLFGGDHQDRDARGAGVGLQRMDDIEPGHVGHHQIEQDEVGAHPTCQDDGLLSAKGAHRRIGGDRQERGDHLPEGNRPAPVNGFPQRIRVRRLQVRRPVRLVITACRSVSRRGFDRDEPPPVGDY
jgi:hypothetical protein